MRLNAHRLFTNVKLLTGIYHRTSVRDYYFVSLSFFFIIFFASAMESIYCETRARAYTIYVIRTDAVSPIARLRLTAMRKLLFLLASTTWSDIIVGLSELRAIVSHWMPHARWYIWSGFAFFSHDSFSIPILTRHTVLTVRRKWEILPTFYVNRH